MSGHSSGTPVAGRTDPGVGVISLEAPVELTARRQRRPGLVLDPVRGILIPALIFVVVNASFLAVGGIEQGPASFRVLAGARALCAGRYVNRGGTSALGYEALVALALGTRVGIALVVAIQMLFALVALYAVFAMGRELAGDRAGSVVAGLVAGLVAACPDLALSNAAIHPGSLFTSLVPLAVWLSYRATKRWSIAAAAVLVFAALLCPEGWVLASVIVNTWLFARVRGGFWLRIVGFSIVIVTAWSAAAAIGAPYPVVRDAALLSAMPIVIWLASSGGIGSWRVGLVRVLCGVVGGQLLILTMTGIHGIGRLLLEVLPVLFLLGARALSIASRRLMGSVAVIVLISLTLATLHDSLLVRFAHEFRFDDPAPCDALVLLIGGDRDRAERVAQLYRQGIAPIVLLGSNPEEEMNREFLISYGVPDAAIIAIGKIASTRDEAFAVADYVKTHPVRRITVVTTAYHTARTRWIFGRALRGSGVEVHTAASDSPDFSEKDWYTTQVGRTTYLREFIKHLYYRIVY